MCGETDNLMTDKILVNQDRASDLEKILHSVTRLI